MKGKNSKAGVTAIIILGVIILIALVPWVLIIAETISPSDSGEPTEEIIGNVTDEEDEPDEYLQDDDGSALEEEPEPLPEPEFGPGYEIPLENRIVEISVEHPELFSEMNELSLRYNAVAVSVVAYDGETGEFFTYEYGYADTHEGRLVDSGTKFRVASLTKLVTAICAMVLVDEGLLDLDADVSIYLGYEVRNNNHPEDIITTRMLLQHTSSVFDSGMYQSARDRRAIETVRQLLENGSSFRRNQPGADFEYSNFGFSVIGAVIENIAGVSLDAYAREVLFDPLGIDAGYVPGNMRDTEDIAVLYNDSHEIMRSIESQLDIEASHTPGQDLHLAHGNLTISAIDYARILAMVGNGGILQSVRILSPDAVRQMHNADVTAHTYEQGLATRYSFGDFIHGKGFYWHSGSAYGAFTQYLYTLDNNTNRGIVVITTGATTGREQNGMISVCTSICALVWRELRFTDHSAGQGGESNQPEADEGV